MFKKIIILNLIFVFLLTSGFGCKGVDQDVRQEMQAITLNYWRVWDGPDAFVEIIDNYNKLHPYININYRKLRYEEYEQELLEAFATDKGPDIFSIHNAWIKKYQDKGFIAPKPDTVTTVYPYIKGTLKKEVDYEIKTEKTISLREIKEKFIDTVYQDVVIKVADPKTEIITEKVFGLPLSIDTLVLYYNRDLFNNAGIVNPPIYWNKEFQTNVKKLTKQNNKGKIIQAGFALGGGDNIERSVDILSVLMMQNGSEMMDNFGTVHFHRIPNGLQDKKYNPGLDALRFYTDFANPAKEVYTWNNNLDNSLELFTQGKLAMMLGYAYMLPQIKTQAPKLNFSLSRLPQIENNIQEINFANYWVEVMSRKSKYQEEAWDFIQFATANTKQAEKYLNKTNKPTALRELIKSQLENEDVSVFAEQILTAKSWYRGKDAITAENIMQEMINKVNIGKEPIENIIRSGASKVQQTVR